MSLPLNFRKLLEVLSVSAGTRPTNMTSSRGPIHNSTKRLKKENVTDNEKKKRKFYQLIKCQKENKEKNGARDKRTAEKIENVGRDYWIIYVMTHPLPAMTKLDNRQITLNNQLLMLDNLLVMFNSFLMIPERRLHLSQAHDLVLLKVYNQPLFLADSQHLTETHLHPCWQISRLADSIHQVTVEQHDFGKKIELKTMKHNRYVINKTLKLQENMIATLKKKINALRMKASRDKAPTTVEQDRKKNKSKTTIQ